MSQDENRSIIITGEDYIKACIASDHLITCVPESRRTSWCCQFILSLLCCQISALPCFLIAFLPWKACWENRAHKSENVVLNKSYDWKNGETGTFSSLVMLNRFLQYSGPGLNGTGVGISLFTYNNSTFMFKYAQPTLQRLSFITDQKRNPYLCDEAGLSD